MQENTHGESRKEDEKKAEELTRSRHAVVLTLSKFLVPANIRVRRINRILS